MFGRSIDGWGLCVHWALGLDRIEVMHRVSSGSPKHTAGWLRPLPSVCCLVLDVDSIPKLTTATLSIDSRRPNSTRMNAAPFPFPALLPRATEEGQSVQLSNSPSLCRRLPRLRTNNPTHHPQSHDPLDRSIESAHTTPTAWFPPLETGEAELLGQLEAQLEQRLLAIQTTPAPPPLGVVDGRAGDEEDEEEEEEVGRRVFGIG